LSRGVGVTRAWCNALEEEKDSAWGGKSQLETLNNPFIFLLAFGNFQNRTESSHKFIRLSRGYLSWCESACQGTWIAGYDTDTGRAWSGECEIQLLEADDKKEQGGKTICSLQR